ncbi:hypothetical protein HDV01_003522 [Terramyces sp. JEL0728]|nr:hypothetical protein HDV01_003522 [Terramyces sp. JEL0728]
MDSEYLRGLNVLIEYKNLISEMNCPSGMYLVPSDDLFLWHGTVFIHRGFYKEGVFKFQINLKHYPLECPTVKFTTKIFHPLIDPTDNILYLGKYENSWSSQYYISHILHYIKDIFKSQSIQEINELYCPHLEALKIFKGEKNRFIQLASQSALKSNLEEELFRNDFIQFRNLNDGEYANMKLKMNQFCNK